jgi:hypothetical protein
LAIRLAFTGLAGVGKTTAADHLVKEYGAVKVSWATPVKIEVHDFLSNFRARGWYDYEYHKMPVTTMPIPDFLPLPPTLAAGWKDEYKLRWINDNKYWLRQMLQWWGTDYRRSQDENYWIKQGLKIIDSYPRNMNMTVDDSRYENEGDALAARGFKIVQIDRPGILQMDHPSEQLLIRPDIMLYNNGTLEKFYKRIDGVVDSCKLRYGDV